MGRAAEVTIDDLIADCRIRRNVLEREIALWESGPDINPAFPLRKLRGIALDLDHLIGRYARN
jgi:hypothetical protein